MTTTAVVNEPTMPVTHERNGDPRSEPFAELPSAVATPPEILALAAWIDAFRAELAGLRETAARVAPLIAERDAWKRAAEQLRQEAADATRKLATADELARARWAGPYQREAERARALQARLNAVYTEALTDLTAGDDETDEAVAVSRALADARAEIERLRGRLAAYGEVILDPRPSE